MSDKKSPRNKREPPAYLKATTTASSRQNDNMKRKEQLDKRNDKDIAKKNRIFSADGRRPSKDPVPSLSATKSLAKDSKEDFFRTTETLKPSDQTLPATQPSASKAKPDMILKQTLELLKKTAGDSDSFTFDTTKEFMIKLNYLTDLKK